MKTWLVAILCCFTMAATLAYAQGADEGYQTARIVSFEKLAGNVQHPENDDQYKMALKIGDTVYLCKASAPYRTFMDWTINKELPARVSGKTLTVKNFDSQLVDLKIDKVKRGK